MKSWGRVPLILKRIIDSSLGKQGECALLARFNHKKDATSNEQLYKVDNDYVDLHDICTELHSSFVNQRKRNSNMSKTDCRVHIKCDGRLHWLRSSAYRPINKLLNKLGLGFGR